MKSIFNKNRIKRKVLVVDDELINRELLEAILLLNYDVSCASNGREALEMLRSAEQPYSLILLDILMPEKSGLQTLEECKADEKLKEIPVIMMTSEKSAEARSIRMGAADFISKPYRMPEVIIARCERVIELTEEKALIRSIETDPETGLYIKVFFNAYVRRLSTQIRGAMDAVAIKITNGSHHDHAVKLTAQAIRDNLLKNQGIACREDQNVFYAYCTHRNDYDSVCAALQEALSRDLLTSDVKLSMGVHENAESGTPIEDWFADALQKA